MPSNPKLKVHTKVHRVLHKLPGLCILSACITHAAPAETLQEKITSSMQLGADFLVEDQNPNGSWGSATRTKMINIYAPLPGAHHAYRAGATGLALSGLIDIADNRPEVQSAIEKCMAWSIENLPKLRRADQTTTYNVWGHAYGLRSLVRLHQLNKKTPGQKTLLMDLAQQQVDLLNRYEDVNGGWGYLDVFDGFTSRRPSGITTSFTSATVLIAMKEGEEALGLNLNPKVVKSSLDSIERQQFPDKSYAYSHNHRLRPRVGINRPAGSLARSQACNAALRIHGRQGITDEVIIKWADRFLEREGWLSIARKRPMPHDIHFQISGYFYYYGIYYFTESVRLLPKDLQKPYAEKLAALIMDKQETDGSWWDYPLYDYHQPYGTGYALMALAWCRNVILA